MSKVKRKPGVYSSRPRKLQRPTIAQILRQMGVVAAVLIIWTGLLVGFIKLTGQSSSGPSTSASPTGAATEPAPTIASVTELPAGTGAVAQTPITSPTAAPPTETPVSAAPGSQISFVADVLPIFDTRCAQCHGSDRAEGGLRLDSYASAMTASANGPVIVPGNSANSVLVRLVESGDMPRRNPRLVPADIQTIRDWIDAGAADN